MNEKTACDASRLLPDMSAIVNQKLVEHATADPYSGKKKVLLVTSLLSKIEELANKEDPSGLLALEHLSDIQQLVKSGAVDVEIVDTSGQDRGSRPAPINEICRDVALDEGATLLTCDPVQAAIASIEGCGHVLLEVHQEAPVEEIFGALFDDNTMSIHLVEDEIPLGKRGKPGAWQLDKIGEDTLPRQRMSRMVNEILNLTTMKGTSRGYLEVNYDGAKVVQFGPYRIAIAYPPVSSKYEITVTRPLVKLKLKDYDLPSDLVQRLTDEAEGILIAGPPGAGKSTFASALANFYSKNHKIVKTLESVRDLQVNPGITQYGAIEGEMEKNADLLLLVRPDYTIFDEVRKTRDFEIYVDLRQAGVGMVGVVHASKPIDAVQRFINRVDLGVLPQVVDTVIFVKDGGIQDIMGTRMAVKVPAGFRDEGLARPVVEVFSFFEARNVLYEIYTFGENVVVSPVGRARNRARPSKTTRHHGARGHDQDGHGHQGGDVDTTVMKPVSGIRATKNSIEFYLGKGFAYQDINVFTGDGEAVFNGTVSSKGIVRIKKTTGLGRRITGLMRDKEFFFTTSS